MGCRLSRQPTWHSNETLGDNLRNQGAVDIGQSHIAAVVLVCELGVIQAKQMQHRRVEVVIRDRLLARLVGRVVAGSDRLIAFDARACRSHGHDAGVMIVSDTAL